MYSTENYAQYLVMTYNGKESKKEYIYIIYVYIYIYICITDSLCCTIENYHNIIYKSK